MDINIDIIYNQTRIEVDSIDLIELVAEYKF